MAASIPVGNPDNPATPDTERRRRDTEALLLLALLTPGDVDAARHLWTSHAPASLRGMLTAEGGWSWDAQRQQYVSRTGKRIGGGDLKAVSLLFGLSIDHDLRADASEMAVGAKPLATWVDQTADEIKDLSIVLAAMAVGGFDQLNAATLKRTSGSPDEPPGIAFSLNRLGQFADDVAAGKPPWNTESGIVNRASLYASAAQGVFEDQRRQSHLAARDESGRLLFLYERNVLGSEDPCSPTAATEGCWDLTQAGWQPIGSMPVPGLRTCAANCRCNLIYSLTGGEHESN